MKYRFKKDNFLNLISHPAFLSLPFFFLIIFSERMSFSPYRLVLHGAEALSFTSQKSLYVDINSDSIAEMIKGYNLLTNATVIAYTNSGSIYEAWNINGKWLNGEAEFMIGDLNEDGTSELYALTISNDDSLWINQLTLKKRQNIKKIKPVCKLSRFNDHLDQDMKIVGFADINRDEKKDVIFYVSSGFILQPRAFFAWDLHNDKMIRSEYSGMNIKNLQQFIHIPERGKRPLSIFVKNFATDNYENAIPFSDTASYAVVFTENLDYLFEPVLLGGPQSNTTTYPMFKDGKLMIMAVVQHFREEENNIGFHIINKNGDVIKSMDTTLINSRFNSLWLNDQLIVIHEGDKASELGIISEKLSYSGKISLPDYFYAKPLNVDDDEKKELIFMNREYNRIGILQDDLKSFVSLSIPQVNINSFFPSLRSIDKEGSVIYLQTADYTMNLHYSKNKLYIFRYFLYAILYLGIFGILLLLQRIFVFTNNRRRIREQKLLTYQLQSVMNQLNPHFTFNAINSIGYAIMEGKKQEAYDYFTKLSGLIRKSMKNAFYPYKTLREEVSFVREYLEIEEYRFAGKLNWTIEIAHEVDLSVPVPKMLIHIFVENSIKHGIFHLHEKGIITIRIRPALSGTEIIVEDNGMGFKDSSLENTDGKGFKILNNYLDIYNSTMKRNISYSIENTPNCGWKVIIHIK